MTPHLTDRESLKWMSPGNQTEMTGHRGRRPGCLLGMGVLALCLLSVWIILNAVSHRPTQALEGTFQNPQAAQVIKFMQGGRKWFYPTTYTATVLVRGRDLRLQPYLRSSADTYMIRRILDGWGVCNELLKKPKPETLYFHNSDPQGAGVLGPGNIEIYGVQHLLTRTYCFVYVED